MHIFTTEMNQRQSGFILGAKLDYQNQIPFLVTDVNRYLMDEFAMWSTNDTIFSSFLSGVNPQALYKRY